MCDLPAHVPPSPIPAEECPAHTAGNAVKTGGFAVTHQAFEGEGHRLTIKSVKTHIKRLTKSETAGRIDQKIDRILTIDSDKGLSTRWLWD